jgi:putative transposase
MSIEERKAVVDYRKSRGYPLHKPPHLKLPVRSNPIYGVDYAGEPPHKAGYYEHYEQDERSWYLISAATFEHQPYFSHPKELTALEKRLLEGFDHNSIPYAAWVVQPNHYHILACPDSLKTVGYLLGYVHGKSSHYANTRDKTRGRRVWYKYSDRAIRSERHFWTTINYIHYNPVKHGYVKKMEDWIWSSVSHYIETEGCEWIEGLNNKYPLYDFGKGWDE